MERESRPVGRPRQVDHGKSTKQLILDEATRMYLDKGYQVVSMADVAAACGVTKATIYYHYQTKADLFTDAMLQLMIHIKQTNIRLLSADKPLQERLTDIAMGHLQATVDIDIHNFMKEAKLSLSNEQLEQMEAAENDLYNVLEETLAEAMEAGEIPTGPPKIAAHAFIAFLTAGKQIIQDSSSLDELVHQIVNFYWNGLGD